MIWKPSLQPQHQDYFWRIVNGIFKKLDNICITLDNSQTYCGQLLDFCL